MVCKLTITLRNDEKTTKFQHLVYEDFKANEDDEVLQRYFAEALKEFGPQIDSAKARIDLEFVRLPQKESD